MVMLLSELFRWWYGAGWRSQAKSIAIRIEGTIDYFSMDILLKTLFSPYRQISAGRVDGSLEVQLHAFIDKLFSRFIGAGIRTVILFIGVFGILLQFIGSFLFLVGWFILPFVPVVGLVLSLGGVTF